MPDVMFQNKRYSFHNTSLNLKYFDSGDLHGNDNFRTENKPLFVYEVLQKIDPALLQAALAATINNTAVPLTAKITEDCTLDIITVNSPEGKTIYYQSLAFLIAQAMYELYPEIRLATLSVLETQCSLQFITNNDFICNTEAIDQQLVQVMDNNAAIQVVDAFQKEMLIETYPSLSQPYAETLLIPYDAYDFVPVAVRKNFVLPVTSHTILAANPKLLTNFSLSHTVVNNIYTITAM